VYTNVNNARILAVRVTLGRQSDDVHGEAKARVLVHYKTNQMNRPNKASTVRR
jgi:hypothetical protein